MRTRAHASTRAHVLAAAHYWRRSALGTQTARGHAAMQRQGYLLGYMGYWAGRPAILHHETKVFFCKYNDPIYVKMEKLEVCAACNMQLPTHPPKDGRARAALSVNQHMHTRTLAQAQP
jgi:hypothetical protein